MFECLILGDSIGVGIAKEINARYARQCDVTAVERATTDQILAWRKPRKIYGASIFAIGSNDEISAALAAKLSRLRQSITTRRVIWLLPYSRERAYLVNSVAVRFGDETLDLMRFRSKDHVHPISYRDISKVLLARP
ncbi:hypothetical protein [uncultured Sphingomonas sp.]|uniref:hypothetical protein n=1 Tax=uncultured Sphingomonas sp. TaxID=158754 RepID=UPI00262086B1|nr:hypothetical protein [uncultured Sphingomonas sp.]